MRTQSEMFNIPRPFCADVFRNVAPVGEIIIGFSPKYETSVLSSDGAVIPKFSRSYDLLCHLPTQG
jgi:hypothetical protein